MVGFMVGFMATLWVAKHRRGAPRRPDPANLAYCREKLAAVRLAFKTLTY